MILAADHPPSVSASNRPMAVLQISRVNDGNAANWPMAADTQAC
jgi:hypothetical protein